MLLWADISFLNEIIATKTGEESEPSNRSKPEDFWDVKRGELCLERPHGVKMIGR